MKNIRILNVRFVNDGRPLKAFVDIEYGELIIREFRVTHRPGLRVFVSPPVASWKDPSTGQIKYKGLITFPPEEKQRIDLAVLQVYEAEKEKRSAERSSEL
jgi:hypothetical protein